MQRGRKSQAALNVVSLAATGKISRLNAPAFLSASEAAMFTELVMANGHLTAGDAPLLACYVQAATKTYKLGKQKDVSAWEKTVRVMMALGRALRLTPQATVRPETVGRQRRDAPSASYYDTMDDADG